MLFTSPRHLNMCSPNAYKHPGQFSIETHPKAWSIFGRRQQLRRRVRMCYWKQWRGTRNRIRQLIKLGTGLKTAILTGISGKGYWRLSRSLGTQTGMTNDWLEQQGLVSIRALWMKAHGYT